MSFTVTRKGDVYYVEDTSLNLVKGRFKTKEDAVQFAKHEAESQGDYFKDIKSNISIKSIDMPTDG